jgi:hypothetical protein
VGCNDGFDQLLLVSLRVSLHLLKCLLGSLLGLAMGELAAEGTFIPTEGHPRLLMKRFAAAVAALLSRIGCRVAGSMTTITIPDGTVRGLGKKGLEQRTKDEGVDKFCCGMNHGGRRR